MFSTDVVDTDKFLEMSVSARCLYYDLGMRADDDGFVNSPKKILRMIGASEDDMKMLVVKGFIIPFESGVVVIKDWKINNYLRSDRYQETIYKEEKEMLQQNKDGVYSLKGAEVSALNSVGIPIDNQRYPQDRLGKVSIGKNKSINTLSLFLSDKEEILKHTKELYPDKNVTLAMEDFIAYCESKYTKYKDFKKAFQNWVREDRYGKYAMAISEQKIEKTEEELDLILYGRK